MLRVSNQTIAQQSSCGIDIHKRCEALGLKKNCAKGIKIIQSQ